MAADQVQSAEDRVNMIMHMMQDNCFADRCPHPQLLNLLLWFNSWRCGQQSAKQLSCTIKRNEDCALLALMTLRGDLRGSSLCMSTTDYAKFMRCHYDTVKEIYKRIQDPSTKEICADVISVLALTMSDNRNCLKYRLLGSQCGIGDWGHEYVGCLTTEILDEWAEMSPDDEELKKKLVGLSEKIVIYYFAHYEEDRAVKLLMKTQHLNLLNEHVDEISYTGVCHYLTSYRPSESDPEKSTLLKIALDLYKRYNQFPQALKIALQLNNKKLMEEIFTSCSDLSKKRQLALMLGRHHIFLELSEDVVERHILIMLMSNLHLSQAFLDFGRMYGYLEPKSPEDICPGIVPFTGDAYQTLAAIFVNGFMNAGFGNDTLLTEMSQTDISEQELLSTISSTSLVMLWTVDGRIRRLEDFLNTVEDNYTNSYLLACGVANCGVRHHGDPALAPLSRYVLHNNNITRICAIVGLGLAYAGSNRESLLSLLTPVFNDPNSSIKVIGMTALACGMIGIGSCNPEVTDAIIHTIMEKTKTDLSDTFARFLPLGLGLCYLGRPKAVEAIIAALEITPDPLRSMCKIMVEACAYVGTRNELKLQHLLRICTEHEQSDKDESKGNKEKESKKRKEEGKTLCSQQAIAVLGMAIITGSSNAGIQMFFDAFPDVSLCNPVLRRVIPLGLGLVSASYPKHAFLNVLHRLAYDCDFETTINAIFAMGLLGAGTKNRRLITMLTDLTHVYAKDEHKLFMARIALGLVHLGKGTITLSPYYYGKQVLSPVALAGLLATLTAFMDAKNIILDDYHYVMFMLTAAMRPKILFTLDEDLKSLSVPMRVQLESDSPEKGEIPEHFGQFESRTTPSLLGLGEYAELHTKEYTSLAPNVEDFVILRKKPNFNP